MIAYSRDPQSTVPLSTVKIIGLGGAGANILAHVTLDGLEGTELLALNTDTRKLDSALGQEKVQLGANLTKGLGTGGDPELGHQAAQEAEDAIRAALHGCRIVFLCVGLGGGTGSGAAPLVTRIAREEGAFVVVFATMPFAFEGKRRREQAETALNQLTVLSNALVTFDNNRMGELVLAHQGIHEAFAAADQTISESIKAVIRLVVRPGLIRIGLDDLMSALRANRSRCLFGSGIASGEDRAGTALRNALASPLLDQGTLLQKAQTVLVHLAGGEDLSLFEIEQLMQELQKSVPENAQVLFGAAVDPAMGDSLSLTLISALPEEALAAPSRATASAAHETTPTVTGTVPLQTEAPVAEIAIETAPAPDEPAQPRVETVAASLSLFEELEPVAELDSPEPDADAPSEAEEPAPTIMVAEFVAAVATPVDELPLPHGELAEPAVAGGIPSKRPPGVLPWSTAQGPKSLDSELDAELDGDLAAPALELELPKLKLGIKPATPQSELSLDSSPRGRFEGENPNVFEGEDLDLPPFLRKKK